MESYELIDLSYDVLDELKNSKEYLNVTTSLNVLSQKAAFLIEEFKKSKAKYNSVTLYGKHHPDSKEVTLNFIQAKTALYQNEYYKDYIKTLNLFNKKLNQFNSKLNEVAKDCFINEKATCEKR
ncbi:MAG: YlbF family regulator [Firmicutes bacterium]|nr:YlbF family regulator [Bacillota bacterium]